MGQTLPVMFSPFFLFFLLRRVLYHGAMQKLVWSVQKSTKFTNMRR